MSIDFSTFNFESKEDISRKANNFVAIHLTGFIAIFIVLTICTNFTYYIQKLLNKNIFKL